MWRTSSLARLPRSLAFPPPLMQVGLLLGVFVGLVGGTAVCSVALFAPQMLTHDPTLWPLLGQVGAGQGQGGWRDGR